MGRPGGASQEGCLEEAWRHLTAGAVLTLDTAARHAPPPPTDPQRGPPRVAQATHPWGPSCNAARPESSGHHPAPSLYSQSRPSAPSCVLTDVSLWAANVAIAPTRVAHTPGAVGTERTQPCPEGPGRRLGRRWRAPLWVCRPTWTNPAPQAQPDRPPAWHTLPAQPAGGSAHLEHGDVGRAVGPHLAAVHLHVLEPLDVGLGIAVHLAEQFHVTAHHSRGVGWESCLKDGPVRGPLWG